MKKSKIQVLCVLFFVPIIQFGQLILKKDSSNLIAFKGFSYLYNNFEDSININKSLELNHKIGIPELNKNGNPLSNLGSEWLSWLYQPNFSGELFKGNPFISPYFYQTSTIPYYIINKPLSELEFTFFGYGAEMFKGLLSQNLSKKLNIGVGIKQINNKGYYDRTSTKHHNYYATINHNTNKISTNLEFAFNDYQIQNSGGFEFEIASQIPQSQYKIQEYYLKNAQSEGEHSYLKIRNTIFLIKPKIDTNITNIHLPKNSPLMIHHEIGYGIDRHTFSDYSAKNSYYGAYLGNLSTISTYFKNSKWFQTINLEYSWQKHDSLKFIIKSGWTSSINQLKRGFHTDTFDSENSWINGIQSKIDISLPRKINWQNSAYLSISGYTLGNYYIYSKLTKSFDNFKISIKGEKYNQRPDYFLENFTTNAYKIKNNFKKENNTNLELEGNWSKQKLQFNIGYRNITKWLTYNIDGMPIYSISDFVMDH